MAGVRIRRFIAMTAMCLCAAGAFGWGVAVLGEADMLVELTQDRLTSEVHRGENRGRSLEHSAVVRSLTAVGSLKPSARTLQATATIPGGRQQSEHTSHPDALLGFDGLP